MPVNRVDAPRHVPTSAGAVSPGWSVALLVSSGLVFAAYPLLRPYSDETTLDGAAAMSSGAWIAAHVCGMAALILLPMGLLGAWESVRGTSGAGTARAAALTCLLGCGLALPYYGAETFGLHAIGTLAAQTSDRDVLELAELTRQGPVPMTMFVVALLLLAACGVLTAVALARSGGRAPRWAGVPFAAALVLFGPQFFAAPALRIAHGVLFAAGCVLLAYAFRRAASSDGVLSPARW